MKPQFPVYTRLMRRAMQVLFVLALPGLVFGFLNSVRTDGAGVYDPMLPPTDPGWQSLAAALLLVPPALVAVYALVVVVEWLLTGPRPGRRAKP